MIAVKTWPEFVGEHLPLIEAMVRHSPHVFCNERDDAFGVAVERALKARIATEHPRARRAALRTVVRYALMDFERDAASRQEIVQNIEDTTAVEAYSATLLDVAQALKDLCEKQRRAVVLEAQGHSTDEIADALGTNRVNVHQLLCRARRTLRAVAA